MTHLDDSLPPAAAITGYTTGDVSHRMAHLDYSLPPAAAITGYTTGDGSHRMAHLDASLPPAAAITGYTTGDGSHWNRFKGNVGDTSERRGGAYMGFSERIDTILH